MTAGLAPSGVARSAPFAVPHDTLRAALTFAIVAAFWGFCHPYAGIWGDANVYLGRAVADLDPTGVGRDMMFVHDGQSRFSLFAMAIRPLVWFLGAPHAAMLMAAFASACWFLALAAFAHCLASGRAAWAIVIVVAVLPAAYGQPGVFNVAETSALPRPFAEAAVLGAFAALLANRNVLAGGLLLAALTLHPIMALPGVATAFVFLLWRLTTRTRVMLLGAVGVAAALAGVAGWLGAPFLVRLVTPVDADWMGILFLRSPHLFPTHWTENAVPPLVAQATSLVVATRLAPPPVKRLFVSVLVVGFGGLAAAAVLADQAWLLLFVQIQLWRTSWLLTVVGSCAFAYCVLGLWPRGNGGRLVLACLVVAWFCQTDAVSALALGAVTMALELRGCGRLASDRVMIGAGVGAGLLVLVHQVGCLSGYAVFLETFPHGLPLLADPIGNRLQAVPTLLATAIWLRSPPSTAPVRASLALASLVLIVATTEAWDQRTPSQVFFTTPGAPPGFGALAAGRPAEVLWLESRGEAWFTLGRPQYLSAQQSVSIVFSRDLAMMWRARAQRLVDLGLVPHSIFTPAAIPEDGDIAHVTQTAIDNLCSRPDAPGVVIWPWNASATPLRDMRLWRMPQPFYSLDRFQSGNRWRSFTAMAVVPCHAPLASPSPST